MYEDFHIKGQCWTCPKRERRHIWLQFEVGPAPRCRGNKVGTEECNAIMRPPFWTRSKQFWVCSRCGYAGILFALKVAALFANNEIAWDVVVKRRFRSIKLLGIMANILEWSLCT